MLDTVPKGLKLYLREISQPKKIKKNKTKEKHKTTKTKKQTNKQINFQSHWQNIVLLLQKLQLLPY